MRSRPTLAEYEEKIKQKELHGTSTTTTKPDSFQPSDVERIDDDADMLAITHHQLVTCNNESNSKEVSRASVQQQKQQRSSTNSLMSINDDDTDVDTSIVSSAPSDCSYDTQIPANANDIAALNGIDGDDDDDLSIGGNTIAIDDNDDADEDNDDDCDEKDVLESFDRIIEEEKKIINDTDIMREEELVEFKERCVKLTDENIILRKEVESLRLNSNKNMNAIIYIAPLAFLLIYYLLSMIFF